MITGELARLIRERDWSQTPLGPRETWSESLQAVVALMLHSQQPMLLWWSAELVQVYNDAYVPSFGSDRHPKALGQRAAECWPEAWETAVRDVELAFTTGQPSYHHDRLIPVLRNGKMEDVYWTYGYSPVFDGDRIGGVLCIVTESTSRVLALRRLHTARVLADAIGLSTTRAQLVVDAAKVLAATPEDAPWVLALDLGVAAGAQVLACHGTDDASGVADALRYAPSGDVRQLGTSSGPAVAVVLASKSSVERHAIVMGLSSRLPYDDAYGAHVRAVFGQIANAAQRIDSQQARVAAEGARNDLLLQAPFAAALLVGPRWRFDLANALYERMVQRPVVGREWHDCFPELHGTPVEQILRNVYERGEAFDANEQHVPLARLGDGVLEDRYFDFNMIPIRSGGEIIDAMMVVAIEVTAKVLARREIEAASRAKDEFLAMMGHELRNPLAPIVTALALMREQGVQSREVTTIERQVGHMTRLVDDLLDISRITQGKIELRKTTTEVIAIVDHAVETVAALLEQRTHRLALDVPFDLCWHGDATRLEQVLSNLLVNAARYTDPGGHISISARGVGEGDVELRVRDTGRGMDAELLARAFQPFVQSDRGKDRREGGLGLGLAIVKGLVALHGGTVTAHSDGPGHGSELVVRVPGRVPRPANAMMTPRSTRLPSARGPRRRVMLVDDNEDAAQLSAEILRLAGHEVHVAYDAPSAIALADRVAPELAILDIGLPVMDGYELVRRLRASSASCRYVALTGYGQREDVERAHDAGFERLLVKPVAIDVLLGVVDG